MLNRRFTLALESLANSSNRLAAAEEKINALRIEQMRNERTRDGRSESRPCVNITPPKQPPKK